MGKLSFGGRNTTGFGVGLFPDHTDQDVLTLIKLYDTRMQQLADSFKKFAPKWRDADPDTLARFITDFALLQTRYAVAKSAASDAMHQILPDQDAAYTAIMKAVLQNFPPDDAAQASGDWADLSKRLTTAQAGDAPPLPLPPPIVQAVPLLIMPPVPPQVVPPPPALTPEQRKKWTSPPSEPTPESTDEKKKSDDHFISTLKTIGYVAAATVVTTVVVVAVRR